MVVADSLTSLGSDSLLLDIDALYDAVELQIDFVLLVPALVSHGKLGCIFDQSLRELGPVDRDLLLLADDLDWASIAGLHDKDA